MATYRHTKNKIKCLQHEGVELFEDSEKLQLGTTHFKSLFLEQRQWVPNIILETLYDSQQVVLDCYMSHSPGVK